MSLTLGIVGLPNVGKSTLFNALTRNDVLAANYPFATIEPNVGVVPLRDPRLDRLAEMFASEKVVPATVSFVDIAGIVAGASEGAGLGNKFLANIREADAICQVVRVFTDDDVVHVDGRVDAAADIETIATELVLADLQTVDRAVPRLEKESRMQKDRRAVLEEVQKAAAVLNEGRTLFSAGMNSPALRELNLLTVKPFLYVFNADEGILTDDAKRKELAGLVAPAEAVFLDAKVEQELLEIGSDDPAAAVEFLQSIGQTEPGLDALARAGFRTLGQGVRHARRRRGRVPLQRLARRSRRAAPPGADSRGMTKFRVHLMTDLTRLDEDGLADLLERLVEVGGVPTVPFGVLEVTGSTKAEDARAAVSEVGRVLEKALQAMNRPCRVIGVQAGEVGPYGS